MPILLIACLFRCCRPHSSIFVRHCQCWPPSAEMDTNFGPAADWASRIDGGKMTDGTGKDRIRLTVDEARALGEAAMRGVGYDEPDARILTDHVLDAALCGYEYSGLPKLLN